MLVLNIYPMCRVSTAYDGQFDLTIRDLYVWVLVFVNLAQ